MTIPLATYTYESHAPYLSVLAYLEIRPMTQMTNITATVTPQNAYGNIATCDQPPSLFLHELTPSRQHPVSPRPTNLRSSSNTLATRSIQPER